MKKKHKQPDISIIGHKLNPAYRGRFYKNITGSYADIFNPLNIQGHIPHWYFLPDLDPARTPTAGNIQSITNQASVGGALIQNTATLQPSYNPTGFSTVGSLQTHKARPLEKMQAFIEVFTPIEMTIAFVLKITAPIQGGFNMEPYSTQFSAAAFNLDINAALTAHSLVFEGFIKDIVPSDAPLLLNKVYVFIIVYSKAENKHFMEINGVRQSTVTGVTLTAGAPLFLSNLIYGNHPGQPWANDAEYGAYLYYPSRVPNSGIADLKDFLMRRYDQ